MPAHRTRAEVFTDAVAASLARLRVRWAAQLAAIEVVVTEMPAVSPPGPDRWREGAPLGAADPATRDAPARLVIHRRPVTDRSRADDLPEVVHAVVVEQLAALLGRSPEEIDPEAGGVD